MALMIGPMLVVMVIGGGPLVSSLPVALLPETFGNTTMDLNANGVPKFEVDFQVPSLEEMERFGKANEMGNMELILAENDKMTTNVREVLIEGDVVVGFNEFNLSRPQQTAVRNRNVRWPNGMVPYFIDNAFDAGARNRILAAVRRYAQVTCIRWVQRTNQRDYVHIVPRQGCFSSVGRQGGRQVLSVGGACNFARGTILHEMMHAIGFQHEQTRTDRDQFVSIFFQNILPGLEYNFQRYSTTQIDNLATSYDYASIMHYPRNAFTRNGRDTIVPRQSGVSIGNRNDFSRIDLIKINRYYQCGDVPTTNDDCEDNNGNCQYWANTGECTGQFANFMRRNCRSSCQICDTVITTPNCVDNNVNCLYWSNTGECTGEFAGYMRLNCRRSCRFCDSNSVITTEDSVCSDTHERCAEWADIGECESNPDWMLPNCELSCRQCVRSIVACADLNENCDMLSVNGECATNVDYMNQYCPKSCGICELGAAGKEATTQRGPHSGVGTIALHLAVVVHALTLHLMCLR